MKRLSDMPNIGQVLEKRLNDAGIYNIQELESIGSREAFKKILNNEGDTCINVLFAIEGAIRGSRWHGLNERILEELRDFYDETRFGSKK